MLGLRGQELLIVLLIIVLIFGARKLPALARSLGSSAKEFRKGIEDGATEVESDSSTSNAEITDIPPPEAPGPDL